jgi:hypothetical protein
MAANTLDISSANVSLNQQWVSKTKAPNVDQSSYSKSDIIKLLFLAFVVMISAFATYTILLRAFDPIYPSGASGTEQTTIINTNAVRYMDQTIRKHYSEGDWRYQGIELSDNIVQLYLKIPKTLALNPGTEASYIKKSVCPNANSPFWRYIKPNQVAFHLFTVSKAAGIWSSCD